jgi:hypothetical protein
MKATVDTWWPEKVRSKRGLPRSSIEKIEAALPRVLAEKRVRLWNGLNQAFYRYWWVRNWRKVPSASEIKKRLAVIAAGGRKLLRHLRVGEQPRPHGELVHDIPYLLRMTLEPAAERYAARSGGFTDYPPRPYEPPTSSWGPIDYRTVEKLNGVVEGLQMLVEWSDDAIEALQEGRDTHRIRRRPEGPSTRDDEALDGLIVELGQLYREVTGKRPGVSRPHGRAGEPGGPFFRFVLLFCTRARIRITADGLEKRWRSLRLQLHASDQVQNKSKATNSPEASTRSN